MKLFYSATTTGLRDGDGAKRKKMKTTNTTNSKCRNAAFALTGLLLLSIAFTSCEKYLNVKTSNNTILIETAEDCQKLLDNYEVMNTGYPSDAEASADNYYLNDDRYRSDQISADDRLIYTWNANAVRSGAKPQWQNPYYIIYNANLILEAVDKLEGADAATVSQLRGSCLFFRGYALWHVAQLYAKPYNAATAEQDPGVPIRNTSDINEVAGRGTVKQTYDRILSDLNEAAALLPNLATPSNLGFSASRPSKAAAYAMLARIYLGMENYTASLSAASSALGLKSDLLDYNTISTSSNTPFARFNTEVIFHTVTADTWMLNSNQFQNRAWIVPELVASYESNDLRRTIFFKSYGSPAYYLFTGNYEPATFGSFFNGLAVDELYLTRAECQARAGNSAAAMADLNTLLRRRYVNTASSPYVDRTATGADDALAKVLAERRKELLMRGQRWTDLRRLNRDSKFAKTLVRTVQGTTYTLPPNDPRYVLLIPNEVIQNAPHITQNPR